VPALISLNIPGYEGRNVLLIAFLVIVVQISDVLQYVWGKLLGRTRIAPTLSPSKTVEGFVGGALSATLIGAGLSWMTPFTPAQAAFLSLVIVMMGFFGGLVMSAIKRDRGVKDWGHLIAGHGGFIDRLDSVVFSAPIFFHLVRYWWSVAGTPLSPDWQGAAPSICSSPLSPWVAGPSSPIALIRRRPLVSRE